MPTQTFLSTVSGVTEQTLDSLGRLMNHTLVHKPWDKSNKSLIRSFIGLDFLKVIYCAGALNRLHVVESFMYLTTSADTTCTKIILTFQQLYQELTGIDATTLLKDSRQI